MNESAVLKGVFTLVCIAVATIGIALSASAGVYKWIDEEGNVHFSQTPPPKQAGKAAKIKVRGMRDDDSKFTLSDQDLEGYCTNLRTAARGVASAMRRGASARRALTSSHGSADRLLVKEIIGFVYGFKDSAADTTTIANLVHTQCMGGGYTRHVEAYLRKKYPDGIPEEYGGQSEDSESDNVTKGAKKSGTGWAVAKGYVITNHHVIEKSKRLSLVLTDGTRLKAFVVSQDKKNDLALLSVDNHQDLPAPIPLGGEAASAGTEVFTIGYPHLRLMGKEPKLTKGIISSEKGMRDDDRYYQISVPVQAGNSGGPLFNMKGEVVGVVTAKLNALAIAKQSGDLPQNVNYAIKTRLVQKLLSDAGRAGAIGDDRGERSLQDLKKDVSDSVMIVLAE